VIDYNHAAVATYTEAEEIVAEANDFSAPVECWIAVSHPNLKVDCGSRDTHKP
jgi:hypothetical protein